MPINLAEEALSAINLGESSVTAIYEGNIRLYPNEVTVSIDGTQSQTGSPGTPMTALTWAISSTDVANYGFTTANESAATLTSLPAGWVGTYANAAGDIPTTGTWTITTTDGKFPLTGVNIVTGSLTRSNPETGFGTLSVTNTGNSTFTGISGTLTSTAFIGSVASVYAAAPVAVGASGQGNTDIGYMIDTSVGGWTGQLVSTTVAGGSAAIETNNGNGSYPAICGMTIRTSLTIAAIGTVSGTTTYTCNPYTSWQTPSTLILAGLNAPPWGGGTSAGPQANADTWYTGTAANVDNRASYQLNFVVSGGTYATPVNYNTYIVQGGPSWTHYSIAGTGSGTYTCTIQTTYGSRPDSPAWTTAASNGSGYGTGPVTSNMT